MIRRLLLSCLSAVLLTHSVYADSLQSLAGIEQTAYVFAMNDAQAYYDNPQITVDAMDKRLRLQACDGKLSAFSSSSADTTGNRTIGIRCSTPTEWTVYVSVKVKVLRPVVVAARALSANQVLKASDVKTVMQDISDLRQGFILSSDNVVGQQLRYSLAMGTALTPRSLKQQKIVQRGEQVILVAQAGSMEVRMNGMAMEDAILGDKIKVKNSSSNRVVEGVVQAPGVVQVTM